MSVLREFELDVDDPAPACRELLVAWKDSSAKVFVLRAGSRIRDVRDYYESLFAYIGTPAPFAEDVNLGNRDSQRTGEIWMEVRYDPDYPDAYRHSANAQPLHTDGSYINSFPNATLFCCVKSAAEGGETVFVDSQKVAAALQKERPSLYGALIEHPILHERSGDQRESPVLYRRDGRWHVNWNYYCVSEKLDSGLRPIADEFFEYLETSPSIRDATVPVSLRPGDAVTWKDDEVLHGRNSFRASAESERFIWKCAINVGVFP